MNTFEKILAERISDHKNIIGQFQAHIRTESSNVTPDMYQIQNYLSVIRNEIARKQECERILELIK